MVSFISMFISLILLVIVFIILTVLGRLGVSAFRDLRKCAGYAMAVMFVFTAASHFIPPMKDDLLKMVPDFLPFPEQILIITGILELLGAIGLLIPGTRRAAGICLILLLIAMFPANINAALKDIPFVGEPATPLWLRIPEQIIYIGMLLWAITFKATDSSKMSE